MPRLAAARDALREHGVALLWFLRKPPGLRLRIGGALQPDAAVALDRVLDAAREAGCVAAWFYSAYEPETHNFGGPGATEAVHRYFDADTRLYVERERLFAEGRIRLTSGVFCLAILSDLFVRTTGDDSEVWDVWRNLEHIYRNVVAAPLDLPRIDLRQLRGLVDAEEAALLSEYAKAHGDLAGELDALWRRGALLWGRRAILPPVAAFLWNRHAVPAPTIAGTVRAMAREWSPKQALLGAARDLAPIL